MESNSDFKIEVYIPSLRKKVQFCQFNNRMYKDTLKYIQNQDMFNLNTYFEHLINSLNPEITSNNLTKVDKFCILLTLRIVCIGSILDLQFKCKTSGQKYTGTIDLNNILQIMTDLECNTHDTVKIDDNVSVKLSIPSGLYITDDQIIEVISDCVRHIIIDDERYNLAELTTKERKNIINKLPGNIFADIISFANKTQDMFKDFIIFTDKSPHDPEALAQDHKLRLYDNSMFEFIKMCFDESLEGFYHMMYSLCSDANMSPEYIEKCTPAEAIMFLNFKKQEIAQQNEAIKKQSNSNDSGPILPNRIPNMVDKL